MTIPSEIEFFNFAKSKPEETFAEPAKPTQYYLKAFRKYKKNIKLFSMNQFNWSAFFFNSLWFFYRKMYLYGFLLMVFQFIVGFFASSFLTFEITVPNLIKCNQFSQLLSGVVCGFIGTPLYIKFAERNIAAGQKESGTNINLALVLAVISFFFAAFLFVVFE